MSDLLAQDAVPAWPGFAGSFGALETLWAELCDDRTLRRSDPKSFPTVLEIMDLSELMDRPLILMRGGWKRAMPVRPTPHGWVRAGKAGRP